MRLVRRATPIPSRGAFECRRRKRHLAALGAEFVRRIAGTSADQSNVTQN
jgi:hypothetical protein